MELVSEQAGVQQSVVWDDDRAASCSVDVSG
jgi:hypothetical protein